MDGITNRRLDELCARAEKETDPLKLIELIKEVNRLAASDDQHENSNSFEQTLQY